MALTPFRRRGKLASAANTARNVAIADAAWALARDRMAAKVPGIQPRRHGPSRKLLLLGGAAAVVVAGTLLKRDKARALLPGGSGQPEPWSPPAPPQPSNYDAPGPVANTATPIPAPDPVVMPDPARDPVDDAAAASGYAAGTASAASDTTPDAAPSDLQTTDAAVPDATAAEPIDEAAEEAAAAAEAAAIGGPPADYTGPDHDLPADEAERPLAESGEGEAEGQEQADAALLENVAPRDAGKTDAERQIEDTIEAAGNPAVGETPEPLTPGADSSQEDDESGSGGWQTWSGEAAKP